MTIVVVKLKHWNQSNNLAVFTVPVWIRHVSDMWQCSKWKVQYTVGDDGVIVNEHLFSSFWPSFSRLALHTSDLDLWFNSTPFWCKNHFCSLKTELLSYKYFFVKTGGDNLLKKRLESRCIIQELEKRRPIGRFSLGPAGSCLASPNLFAFAFLFEACQPGCDWGISIDHKGHSLGHQGLPFPLVA